jgi:radical SAM protein with 4Fe4S-binding SPASM domain
MYNPVAKGLGNKNCAACDGLISISPSGDLLPCSSWDGNVGNVLKKGFQKTWFSKEARKIKNKEFAPQVCKSCSSFTACQGACPLYWNYCGTELLNSAGGKK